jgi:hypothetical protein
MTAPDSLPTDTDALRALLLAERARHGEERERWMAIIAELQRSSADTCTGLAPGLARLKIRKVQRHQMGRRPHYRLPNRHLRGVRRG